MFATKSWNKLLLSSSKNAVLLLNWKVITKAVLTEHSAFQFSLREEVGPKGCRKKTLFLRWTYMGQMDGWFWSRCPHADLPAVLEEIQRTMTHNRLDR